MAIGACEMKLPVILEREYSIESSKKRKTNVVKHRRINLLFVCDEILLRWTSKLWNLPDIISVDVFAHLCLTPSEQ